MDEKNWILRPCSRLHVIVFLTVSGVVSSSTTVESSTGLTTLPDTTMEVTSERPCGVSGFLCNNGTCISRSLVNNSYPDCVDNSDEGFFWRCARENEFKCTTGALGRGVCRQPDYVGDNRADCHDRTDEQKFIGWPCNEQTDCCPCSEFVQGSECSEDGVCGCEAGRYSNTLGTTCTQRILGDSCASEGDCSNAIDYSRCVQDTCHCQTGYHASSQNYTSNTTCLINELYDSCSTDEDCTLSISHSVCSSVCVCDEHYVASSDNTTCNLRYAASEKKENEEDSTLIIIICCVVIPVVCGTAAVLIARIVIKQKKMKRLATI